MSRYGTLEAICRKFKLRHYRNVRAGLDQMTEADLADIGAKRYQLGAIARKQALL
jgi:uncharacterized protein YjiS (DUF1127 family)